MTTQRLPQSFFAALCLLIFAYSAAAQTVTDESDAVDALPTQMQATLKVQADEQAEANGMLGTTSGEQVYTQICQGCHMPNGAGAKGGGSYPAFAGNPALASVNYLASVILNGRRNMPAFARDPNAGFFFEPVWLSDQQIANVINYIRNDFGNHYPDPISAAQVRALRPTESDAEAKP